MVIFTNDQSPDWPSFQLSGDIHADQKTGGPSETSLGKKKGRSAQKHHSKE